MITNVPDAKLSSVQSAMDQQIEDIPLTYRRVNVRKRKRDNRIMTTFWKVRIATLIWGFFVILYFTGNFDFTSKIFFVQVIGNTLLMKFFIDKDDII